MKVKNVTEDMVNKVKKKDLKQLNDMIDSINCLKPSKSEVQYINSYIESGSSFYALQCRVFDVYKNLTINK